MVTPFLSLETNPKPQKNTQLIGQTLRVEAICMPFIACVHQCGHICNIDTRDAEIVELSDDWVELHDIDFDVAREKYKEGHKK